VTHRHDESPRRGCPTLEDLRRRGYGGGVIAPHRAMITSPHHATKILGMATLTIVVLYVWLFLITWVTRFWGWTLDFWREALGMSGVVEMWSYPFGIAIPYLQVSAGPPSTGAWLAGLFLMLALFTVSFLLPWRFLPLAYLIRLIAFFQACAQVYFLFWPRLFPYTASGYLHGMLIANLFLISIVPFFLAFTYYIFDFSLGRKIGLTAVIMLYQCMFVPLQYAAHALIMWRASLLYMPVLFFVWGLPLNVMMYITLYGWGMSWKDGLRRRRFRPRRPGSCMAVTGHDGAAGAPRRP